jgi:hypothetical protein
MASELDLWWEPRAWTELPEPAPEQADPELSDVTSRVIASGSDVIVVDLSHPGLPERGLWTVKVIVPEAYPMTFDAMWPQHGGHRMTQAPVAAGLLDHPVNVADLRTVPHPFP